MGYVPLIEEVRIFSKRKYTKYFEFVRHSIGRNFEPIVTKLGTNVGLIKLQIKFKNEICEARLQER